MTTANSRQVGGSHYKADGKGEEHWDRVARLGLDYFQAQITKYVERCWKKNGIEDLEKAQHFLQKYIEIQKAKKLIDARPSSNFIYEGVQGDWTHYQCRLCHKHFSVPSGQSPEIVHALCDTKIRPPLQIENGEPTRAYVDQGK